MTSNFKCFLILLMFLLALGVVGDMDYQDALADERARAELWTTK